MKTTSIDALRQRKIEISKEMDATVQANQALLDKADAEKRDLTEAEAGEFKKNTDKNVAAKGQLSRFDVQLSEVAEQLEREKSMNSVADNNRAAADRGGQPTTRRDGFKSFGEQLAAVVRYGRTGIADPRLRGGDFDATGRFQASGGSDGSLNEAVPSEGGFLVGADNSDEIYQRTYQTGEVIRRCQRQPISANSNRLKLKVVDEDSRADGSRMGGVLAFWQNEADTFISSRPRFRIMELNLNKLTALLFATDELLSDAPALEAWVMNNLPAELTFRVEDAIFNGTGVGQPAGIFSSQATIQCPGANSTSGGPPQTADILAMWARFWHPGLQGSIAQIQEGKGLTAGAGPMPGAAWFIDQTVLPGLFQLTLGTGTAVILLYHPPGYNGLPGPYGQLLGLPVIPTEHNVAVGAPGDILLADLSQYLVADKGGVQAASSMHVRFLQDEMTFRFTFRVDGQATWKKPLTPKSGGSTLSPFLTLTAANR